MLFQAPSGERFRSMVEVQKFALSVYVYRDWFVLENLVQVTKMTRLPSIFQYVIQHPEYKVDGLSMSQFSFQIPRPLQEKYVRKRPAAPHLTAATHSGRPLEPTEGMHL